MTSVLIHDDFGKFSSFSKLFNIKKLFIFFDDSRELLSVDIFCTFLTSLIKNISKRPENLSSIYESHSHCELSVLLIMIIFFIQLTELWKKMFVVFLSTWNLQVQSKGSQTGAMRWKSLRISKPPEDPFCCLHPLKMFIVPRFNKLTISISHLNLFLQFQILWDYWNDRH